MPVKKILRHAKTGGSRGGRPSSWKFYPKTKLIRVPVKFADRLLELARYMDVHGGDLPSNNTSFNIMPRPVKEYCPDSEVKGKEDDLILVPSWTVGGDLSVNVTCQHWVWFLSPFLSFPGVKPLSFPGVKLVAVEYSACEGEEKFVTLHFNACTLSPVTGYKVPVVISILETDVEDEGSFLLLVDEIYKLYRSRAS